MHEICLIIILDPGMRLGRGKMSSFSCQNRQSFLDVSMQIFGKRLYLFCGFIVTDIIGVGTCL